MAGVALLRMSSLSGRPFPSPSFSLPSNAPESWANCLSYCCSPAHLVFPSHHSVAASPGSISSPTQTHFTASRAIPHLSHQHLASRAKCPTPLPYPKSEGPAATSSPGSSETAFPTYTSPLSQPANARQERHSAVALNIPERVFMS